MIGTHQKVSESITFTFRYFPVRSHTVRYFPILSDTVRYFPILFAPPSQILNGYLLKGYLFDHWNSKDDGDANAWQHSQPATPASQDETEESTGSWKDRNWMAEEEGWKNGKDDDGKDWSNGQTGVLLKCVLLRAGSEEQKV